jgi:hypothetical protein
VANGPRTLVDHLTTGAVVLVIGLYGVISLAAVITTVAPGPAGSGHGFAGLMIFQAIGALYATAAILQLEYGLLRSWQPGWRQGLTLVWFGGWSLMMATGGVRQFLVGGLPAARDFMGGAAIVLGLFVVLPWVIVTLRELFRSDRYEGFIR